MKELRLQFVGDKNKLHKQFKVWCSQSEMRMTPTIMEFIKQVLNDKKFAKTVKDWRKNQ